jgi:phosphohistidine phosphatase
MELYLIRHAEAEDSPPKGGDAERRLTPAGRHDFARVVAGLRKLDPELTRILTSPLIRARQTAEILQEQLPGPRPEEWALLAPGGSLERLLQQLREAGDSVALVGHEPGLGRLVSLAVGGRAGDGTPLRKGGVARISFDSAPKPGGGRLLWFLAPRLLRRIGRAT